MAATDVLKTYRDKGYASTAPDAPGDKPKDGMDKAEENSTSRIIKLSDDEQKAFAQAKPGEDLTCEVHGSLEADGHFHVMSVGPMGGGQSGDAEMAGMVAQRVQPNIAPSPS